jgi:hypothetical protein
MRSTAPFPLLLAVLTAGPLLFSSSLGIGLAQRTQFCTTSASNIVNVAANSAVALAPNKVYRFAGGVNTLSNTFTQASGTWICLIGLNGAILRPPANSVLVSQSAGSPPATLFLANLTIDGGPAATAGGRGRAGAAGVHGPWPCQCHSIRTLSETASVLVPCG